MAFVSAEDAIYFGSGWDYISFSSGWCLFQLRLAFVSAGVGVYLCIVSTDLYFFTPFSELRASVQGHSGAEEPISVEMPGGNALPGPVPMADFGL